MIIAYILVPAVVYLLITQHKLKKDIERLQRQISFEPDAKKPLTSKSPAKKPELPLIAKDARRPAQPALTGAADPVSKGPIQPVSRSKPSPIPPAETAGPPGAVVMRKDKFDALIAWMQENWFYGISAISLALAGIFMVQYSIENSLISPTARVLLALLFGASLVVAGEFIRRRYGDGEGAVTAYLPSTFSSAGIVSLFAAILSANMLYDLIGPGGAMVGMVLVAALAIVLGWFYGPLLAAVGIIGAMGAPMVLGGSNSDPSPLFAYFGLVTITGLFVDAIRRWAWVSILSLVLGFATSWMIYQTGGQAVYFMMFATVIAFAAIAIPVLQFEPRHSGTMISQILAKTKDMPWPEFPTRLAAGTMVASCLVMTLLSFEMSAFWVSITCLMFFMLGLTVWARNAVALQDLVVLPAVGFIFTIALEASNRGDAFSTFRSAYAENPEAAMPMQVTILFGLALFASLAMAWRSFGRTANPVLWAAGAVLFAPAVAIFLEMTWQPSRTIGAYAWGLHAAVLAAVMVFLAERYARRDGDDRLRTALATLSALSAISFGLFIVLSSVALTIALCVTVTTAAALDRKFKLPPMGWFISIGVVVLGYRIIADPGLSWAEFAPVIEVLLAYGTPVFACVASLFLLRDLERPVPRMMLDSAAWSMGGIFLSVVLYRWIEWVSGYNGLWSHWYFGITATIWLSLMIMQIQRYAAGGKLRVARIILAAIYGTIGMIPLLVALTFNNPLLSRSENILGLPLFNTLAPTYLLPAIVLVIGILRIKAMPKALKFVFGIPALGLASFWLVLVIRHFWQGNEGMASSGTIQPELYTYTVTLLIIGAGLLFQSMRGGVDVLRKAGLVIIGIAVIKVFFVDVTGLEGLMRVFSFLALGLSLAGLAWLNRWVQRLNSENKAG
ncbi:DUF2339 domain-containing protein [Parasulfitobacter algicola]|uniref:DUF2339 domain-containing protein n=1 Tax=Parasulfitobacter algicola TaxID=2614809 RepID=UPI001C2CC8DB|nr:DUF2339 domain-containing protein [Sulfitobacter algicola]